MAACNEGRLEEAEAKLTRALDQARATGIKCLEAKILNNLGIIYTFQGAWDKALLIYEKALDIIEHKIGKNNWFHAAVQRNLMKVLGVS